MYRWQAIQLNTHARYACGFEYNAWLNGEYRMCAGSSFTKLQALVYDILPSTTAVFSYAIGSRKLSAYEQFLLVPKQ